MVQIGLLALECLELIEPCLPENQRLLDSRILDWLAMDGEMRPPEAVLRKLIVGRSDVLTDVGLLC